MKLKPIIICNEFYFGDASFLEQGELTEKLDAYFAEAVSNGTVNTLWSTGMVYQDTIVLMQDPVAPSGPDGTGFVWNLSSGAMLQVVKMFYKNMEMELRVFRLEHRHEFVVASSWFAYKDELADFELKLKELKNHN